MQRIMTRKATKQSANKAVVAVTTTAWRPGPRTKITPFIHCVTEDNMLPKGDPDAAAAAARKLLDSGTKPLTCFQRKVLQALCRVPAGHVTTYKQLAQSIHCSSTQAVGQALRRNPYAPTVPCHRVVATTAFVATTTTSSSRSSSSDTSSSKTASYENKRKGIMLPIGGFGGCLSGEKIDKKIQLLQNEGVKFIDATRGTIDPSCLYTFPTEGED
jgi:methylated-DNA-[protein]-cysteine S-methyltransferase